MCNVSLPQTLWHAGNDLAIWAMHSQTNRGLNPWPSFSLRSSAPAMACTPNPIEIAGVLFTRSTRRPGTVDFMMMRLLLIAVDLYRARQKRDRCPEMIIACHSQILRLDVIQTAVSKKRRLFSFSSMQTSWWLPSNKEVAPKTKKRGVELFHCSGWMVRIDGWVFSYLCRFLYHSHIMDSSREHTTKSQPLTLTILWQVL